MCTAAFIALNCEPWVCDYLLAKFIIFCVFSGLGVCNLLATDNGDHSRTAQLFAMAIAFELAVLLLAAVYLVVAVAVGTEVLCTLIVCGCFCCVMPLVYRAQARGAYTETGRQEFMSTIIVAVACAECGEVLCGVGTRVDPGVGGRRREIRQDLMLVAGTARCVMNVV